MKVIPLSRTIVRVLVLVLMLATLGPLQLSASASPSPGPGGGAAVSPAGQAAGPDLRWSVRQNQNDNDDNDDDHNNQPSDSSTTSSSASAPAPVAPYVGIWTTGSPSQAPQLDDLGVGWARVVAAWSAIEPANDAYNWADLDSQINTASGGGRRQVLVMVRNNPAWASGSRCKVSTDAERANLAEFLTALVNRYKDRVKYWQLYNEMDNTNEAFDQQYDLGGCFGTAVGTTPTEDGRNNYARMIETVGAAIHDADSDAQVVGGALVSGNYLSPECPTCLFDADFGKGVLRKLREDGALDQLNYLSVHFFSSQHPTFDAYGVDLLGRVNKLRQDMRDAGLSERRLKPIIVDEGSYTGMISPSTSDSTNAFNRAQRDYVVKALTRAASANVVYFWFWIQDVAPGGLGGDNAYGLIATDGVPKPSYTAFRYITSLLGSTDGQVDAINSDNSKLEGYAFTLTDGRRLQVVWNNVDTEQLTFEPDGRVMSVSDPVGNQIPTTGRFVAVGDEPRYIFTRP